MSPALPISQIPDRQVDLRAHEETFATFNSTSIPSCHTLTGAA
jgi:hypothetical protein